MMVEEENAGEKPKLIEITGYCDKCGEEIKAKPTYTILIIKHEKGISDTIEKFIEVDEEIYCEKYA